MVFCLQNLRTIASKEEREAELALLAGGNIQEAEGHYLHANKPLHAIMLHLNEHNWDRFVTFEIELRFDFLRCSALELTQRHSQYLDVVVGYRQKYLKEYGGGKKETNQKYIQAMKMVC